MKKYILLFLFAPWLVFGQTAIYRSVQNNTSAIFTSGASITLTISGTTATFSSGAGDTVGVGNVIQYDSSNAGAVNAVCFISGRTSSTIFSVQRFQGGTPASCSGDTDWSIFHAYTTLANCESGTENTGIAAGVRNFDAGNRNLSTANETWKIACYNSTVTTISDWNGWTTTTTKRLKIYTPYLTSEVGRSQRHSGKWTNLAFRIELTGGGVSNYAIMASGGAAKDWDIEGLQIWIKSNTSSASGAIGILLSGCTINVSYCILRGANNGATNTIADYHVGILGPTGSSTTKIWNNIVFDFKSPSTTLDFGIRLNSTGPSNTVYVYNNTVYNSTVGISDEGAGANVIQKNNLCASNTTDFSGADAGCEYNASSDASAPGTNSRTNQTFTFVDATNRNLFLATTDAGAKNFGKDLSADANRTVVDDIIRTTRPQGSAFDIGAHEIISSGGRHGQVILIH